MDRFGEHWKDHHVKVAANWRARVGDGDIVLLPGDFSWAMTGTEAAVEFEWLASLPGKKVLIKGNHDYWWPKTKKKLEALLPDGVYAIKKTSIVIDGLPVIGVRGSDFPGDHPSSTATVVAAEFEREMRELALSIEHLRAPGECARPPVAMFHYPPFVAGRDESPFTRQVEDAGCRQVVYGHLHTREEWGRYFQGEARGVKYHLVSCDALDFSPLLLEEL
jgi:hypothetical protein